MRILLVNVDSKFNIAIRKMYTHFLKNGHDVEMLDLKFKAYPHTHTHHIDGSHYDRVYVSNIFEMNKDCVTVSHCPFVEYGGIGSNFPSNRLPEEIENEQPYYFDHEDTSYGFLTRGCIRNCWFCKVPKYEGKLKEYNCIEDIVKHKKVVFMDNNILAYDRHLEVFQWLIDHDIKCNFNQGLDFRLATDENMELLSKLKYIGGYYFAFDDEKYMPLLESKMKIIKRWIPQPYRISMYVYYNPNMPLQGLIDRIRWCREHECLPYIMRDKECWNASNEIRDFITDIASYCNQPAFFKKMSFEEFLQKRTKDTVRIDRNSKLWNTLYTT